MAEELDTDVCVVGAGPAGLALSLMMLRSGFRVALVERSPGFRREFHGELLQPGGQRVLDDLGVLTAAAARGAASLRGVQVLERGQVLLDLDYGRLPAPYDHLLALPQAHVLKELLAACRSLPGFVALDGHRIAALVEKRPGSPCRGAVLHGPGRVPVTVRASVVVGADGRFSRTRALAGIDAGRCGCFPHEVLWLSLRAPRRAAGRVRVHRGPEGVVLVHDSHPDRVRLAWTLPQGRTAAAAGGLRRLRRELAGMLPEFADLLYAQLGPGDAPVVLDGSAAHAREWVRDGLVLLGESAHAHGPVGAQGIGLALQDAAVLHPVLVAALHAQEPTAQRLAAYQERRAPVASAVHRMQAVQVRAVFGDGPRPAGALLRARATGLAVRTPFGARLTRRIAHGHDPAGVRTDLFTVLPAHRGRRH
ncbi:FAD-dependent monooxygenase [Streptomyces bambusae]|uniref:FAD-dependent monooxygenase n=1 Tax=Streptomyces bambusae TaxID=1550616 RepID=UPI001CFC5D2A|nr:FAD-dependent monooxygenase [Streptomyces bambusae]MCB5165723.1 FAD-dependent monooxygenase [Streptomyces bambusae]